MQTKNKCYGQKVIKKKFSNRQWIDQLWINSLEQQGTFDKDYIYFYIQPVIFYGCYDNNLQIIQVSTLFLVYLVA